MNAPPSSQPLDFGSFQERLQECEPIAVKELFDEYSRRLIQLARNNIHPALLKRFDGEDVVQSVFRSFFRRQEAGDFQIEHSQQLWQLLATLTLFNTRSHARKHTAQKRNATVEQEMLDEYQLLDHQSSPEDALALWEEIDAVLHGLPGHTAEIISMRREGRDRSAIGKEMILSRQMIHRILKFVQTRLEQRFEQFSSRKSPGLGKKSKSG